MEKWKDIKGYEGLYQVSDKGRVRSLDRKITYPSGHNYFFKGTYLSFVKRSGYRYATLNKNNKRKNFAVHRLVCQEFIRDFNDKEVTNHKDFNRSNNELSNLEIVTQKQNVQHAKHLFKGKRYKNNNCMTNTGEKYINLRKKYNSYRVTIDRKEYVFKKITCAILHRNAVLAKEGVVIESEFKII